MKLSGALTGVRSGWPQMSTLVVALVATSACGMAGFGGSLQLNITDKQTRELIVDVRGSAESDRLLEIGTSGEVELGVGTARIDRYVLHRTTFGSGVAVGYFLCPKPCMDPLSTYLVAYSPDQIFTPDGQLELRFRAVSEDGSFEELARLINAEMLPSLWRSPKIEATAGRS